MAGRGAGDTGHGDVAVGQSGGSEQSGGSVAGRALLQALPVKQMHAHQADCALGRIHALKAVGPAGLAQPGWGLEHGGGAVADTPAQVQVETSRARSAGGAGLRAMQARGRALHALLVQGEVASRAVEHTPAGMEDIAL